MLQIHKILRHAALHHLQCYKFIYNVNFFVELESLLSMLILLMHYMVSFVKQNIKIKSLICVRSEDLKSSVYYLPMYLSRFL